MKTIDTGLRNSINHKSYFVRCPIRRVTAAGYGIQMNENYYTKLIEKCNDLNIKPMNISQLLSRKMDYDSHQNISTYLFY